MGVSVLLKGAVELGDVIPAPSRTVLTPYYPTPHPNSQGHNAVVSNTTLSVCKSTNFFIRCNLIILFHGFLATPVNAQEEVREV